MLLFGSDGETSDDDEEKEGLRWVGGEWAEIEGEEEEFEGGEPGDEEGGDGGDEGGGEVEREESEEREDGEEREESVLAFGKF